jgi:hypothetical protein
MKPESIQNTFFWDVMPYSFMGKDQYFGGTYCLHLQDGGKQFL